MDICKRKAFSNDPHWADMGVRGLSPINNWVEAQIVDKKLWFNWQCLLGVVVRILICIWKVSGSNPSLGDFYSETKNFNVRVFDIRIFLSVLKALQVQAQPSIHPSFVHCKPFHCKNCRFSLCSISHCSFNVIFIVIQCIQWIAAFKLDCSSNL